MSKRTYRDIKDELDKVLDDLQDPATDIDEALELHKKAEGLITELETYLDGVDAKVKKESQ
jgi:exodeoxyribonuclease VII small subunit